MFFLCVSVSPAQRVVRFRKAAGVEDDLEERVKQAARAIVDADSLLITAGAGMGVDSGLPDFRGNDGFWQAYPPFKKLGLSFAELATPGWFKTDPGLAWGFYGHRRNLYRDTTPQRGFEILRRWAAQKPGGAYVFTSNVDGQFAKAGFAPEQIVECHGSILHAQCSRPCTSEIWPDASPVAVEESTMRAQPPFPLCPHCGSVARPNILMFGDGGWIQDRTYDQEWRLESWVRKSRGEKIVVIEMGAGKAIPTVRAVGERWMSGVNTTLIRINPRDSQGPTGTISLPMGSLDALERIASSTAF